MAFLSLHFLFLYSHSKITEAQWVSQRIMSEIEQYAFSECLVDNRMSSFDILTQRYDLFTAA